MTEAHLFKKLNLKRWATLEKVEFKIALWSRGCPAQSFNSGEPVSHSEVRGPLAGGVKDTKDFNGICADSIGNDVGCVANDQLART